MSKVQLNLCISYRYIDDEWNPDEGGETSSASEEVDSLTIKDANGKCVAGW